MSKNKKKDDFKEWFDPVVEETRERGRALTARLGNDPKKIMDELRRMEKADPNKGKYVSEIKIVRKTS